MAESVKNVGEAIARVASCLSETILIVRPSSPLPGFDPLPVLQQSREAPEILHISQHADPFLSTYHALDQHRRTTVLTSSHALSSLIPHLSRLIHEPIVLHVALAEIAPGQVDYTAITTLRHSGFAFLQSETLQEAQDMAFTAHALARRSKRAVVHFFDPQNSRSDNPIAPENASLLASDQVIPNDQDSTQIIRSIWTEMAQNIDRSYVPFEYSGPADAQHALFIFGSTGIFVDEMLDSSQDFSHCGIITARLYRPWDAMSLISSLPPSIKRIAVLEQSLRHPTRWGPILLDILPSLRETSIEVISHRLGMVTAVTARQALKGVYQNLTSPSPVQNLQVGQDLIFPQAGLSLPQPELENAYMKMLTQLFGQQLFVANPQASPAFGFGALIARSEKRADFPRQVAKSLTADFATPTPITWLKRWLKDDDVASETIARLETDGSATANALLENRAFFTRESSWLIGSDAWAFDVGNSGVHHVLASGRNINMLIVDSQPYSEKVAADAHRRKKDIGLYAMTFGNAYVASVAVYSSYTQVLEAMIEADRFPGPSIVLAYLPYNEQTDSPLTVLQETKKAVDLGYWPLYRWHPSNEDHGRPNFQLDSERIKQELQDFLRRDNQLTQLMNRYPQLASNLTGPSILAQQQQKSQQAYEQMLESRYTAPLTVLYASDNGNAENLAKRLGTRGRTRGLKTTVMSMDAYSIDDLISETNLVLVTSTAGQGEFPQNGKAFWEVIKSTELNLGRVHWAVFALGDSHYWPRPEDRHYYNKSGKDLDARVAALGAQRLVEVGLGDDQDPDGYQTAYGEWEPELWRALQVDVEGGQAEAPAITNEDIKIQSDFLRGTIVEGLTDESTGAIAASDQQLTKFHGTYMQDDRDVRDERKALGLEPAYSFMIRCRLNGGVATPQQWLQMDQISSEFGNGTMKMTTRQTFQFHGVIKRRLKPAMRDINKALMTTIAACGDVNRNVMCSILPTKSAYHGDVHRIAARISDHLLPATSAYHEIWLKDAASEEKQQQVVGPALIDQEPLYGPTYLPRKFKITIAIPPHNDTDVYAHDVGLIAINEQGRLAGFNVLVGGGMGVTHNNKKTYPRTGSVLGYVEAEQAHLVCEKIMLVQRDHGDRQNRKHARLKYTVDDMGVETFRAKVEGLLGWQFSTARPFHFDSNVDTFGWQRDEFGYHHHTFFIENGRIEDTPDFPMKTGLRELARVHKGEFRLTGNQHLCLSNVPEAEVGRMKRLMQQYKLDNVQFSGLRLSSSACVAFPTCGLAMAESERYLPLLISKLEVTLEEVGLRHDSIVMRMTGCPNGCARPWLGEIGLVGKAYGAYNLYLGGGYHGQRLNKLYRESIQEAEILDILRPMLRRYAGEREAGERFGDWVIRAGYVKPTTEGKLFHEEVSVG